MAARGFSRPGRSPRPHAIGGVPADLADAASAAAALLHRARAPLFYGLSADLAGVRAVLALADRVGGIVDHGFSPLLLANMAVARASGWVTATFAEVANRADAILVVGGDPGPRFPRFRERLVANAHPLYRPHPPELLYVGPREEALDPSCAAFVAREELLDALGLLAMLVCGMPAKRPSQHPAALALEAIASRLGAARYAAIVWDAAAFLPGEAEYGVELVSAMLRGLNAATRCVGLPLGGSGNGIGAMQAALWQTGWPLPVGSTADAPVHDPRLFSGSRRIAAGEADIVVWVAALTTEAPPPSASPVIAIVADDIDLPEPPAVEIRVGIPAIDHAGAVFRSDTVIALPLRPARPSARPTVADAANAILASLPEAS